MIDATTIHHCVDPALKPAIIEKFIRAVGSPDPLTVTIRAGNRVVLMSPPKTPDQAMALVRRYVGQAMVRVGVTQYPAGLGVSDVSELHQRPAPIRSGHKPSDPLFGNTIGVVE